MAAAASHKTATSVSKRREGFSPASSHKVPWGKKMSNNCAVALLVYTLLQIFVVTGAIVTKGMSIAPYFGLVLLVAIIIPFCRKFEQRWEKLDKSNLPDAGLATRFRRDQIILWTLALGLPFVFVMIFKTIGTMV